MGKSGGSSSKRYIPKASEEENLALKLLMDRYSDESLSPATQYKNLIDTLNEASQLYRDSTGAYQGSMTDATGALKSELTDATGAYKTSQTEATDAYKKRLAEIEKELGLDEADLKRYTQYYTDTYEENENRNAALQSKRTAEAYNMPGVSVSLGGNKIGTHKPIKTIGTLTDAANESAATSSSLNRGKFDVGMEGANTIWKAAQDVANANTGFADKGYTADTALGKNIYGADTALGKSIYGADTDLAKGIYDSNTSLGKNLTFNAGIANDEATDTLLDMWKTFYSGRMGVGASGAGNSSDLWSTLLGNTAGIGTIGSWLGSGLGSLFGSGTAAASTGTELASMAGFADILGPELTGAFLLGDVRDQFDQRELAFLPMSVLRKMKEEMTHGLF